MDNRRGNGLSTPLDGTGYGDGTSPSPATPGADSPGPPNPGYPPSYNIHTGEYRQAARQGLDEYLDALAGGDRQALNRARQLRAANPPDHLFDAPVAPRIGAYDSEAEAERGLRFQNDWNAIEGFPFTTPYIETARDHGVSERRAALASEAGAGVFGMAMAVAGAVGGPPVIGAPVGRPAAPFDRGDVLEGALRVDAHANRGAIRSFNTKYGNDNGFDQAHFIRNGDGSPQVIVASAKAYDGRKVPLYGTGSLTELGTNNEATRARAEKELIKGIKNERTGMDYTDEDKAKLIQQVREGKILVDLVGLPTTRFTQDHVDFINGETPYRFRQAYALDPFSPALPRPVFNGAAYGVPSVYLGADRKRHP